ncbi:MAG: RibD family protein [Rikenellaceae bacterium]|nr:RibD family protein [Rikenellaceae bacterium]
MRPKIVCHMMSSVDGRLLTDRYTESFDGRRKEDFYDIYFRISRDFHADGWIVGRKTVQESDFTKTFEYDKYPPAEITETWHGKYESERYAIVIDPKGKIIYEDDRFDGDNIITILGEGVSQEYLNHLRDMGISYLFAGPHGSDLNIAVETLRNEFGIEKLLLEGGGIINGKFLKEGLIDELSLLVYPGIDGLAGIPTIFEYFGKQNELPAQGQSLELTEVRQLDPGLVWLRYKFHVKQTSK